MNIVACIEFAVPFSSVPCMASTTKLVSFHPRILLFSVLFVVTASDANFSRLVVVGGHHDLSVSDDRGICPRTRASIVLCNVFAATACCFGRQPPQTPGIVPSVTACRLEAACTHEEEDDEDRMMLFGRRPPPRPQSREEDAALHLPMDRRSRHLHALPGQIFAERPSPVVNSVVDRTRTGLLWSNRSPSVCRQKPSVIISSSPTPSHSIDLIVYSSGSEEQLSAHGNMDRMYCSDLVELEEDEYLLDEPCTGLDHPWPYDLSDDDIPGGISPLDKWKAEELSGSNRDPPRRMLPGKAGPVSASHIAPTKRPHVALHHQLRWTRRLQASVATGGLALLGLICAVAAGLLHCCTRRKRLRRQSAAMAVELGEFEDNNPEQFRGLTWPRRFLYSEMAAATGDFAEDTKIGRGGFGPVYRGYLTEEDRHVAIKVLTAGEQSRQGMREFQAEVTVMSQLRHRNIVQLLGWCDCRRGLLLVYEFMPEGSLDKHLYDTDRLLSWPDRYNIALGLGSALQYLHQDCDRCVVHGDIKPANVMLDASRNAKLGDFGLARLVDHGAEPQTTQVVAGTVGYIDPEFVDSRRPSNESDVYSFGVVLLEIACGRRPTSSSRRPDGAPALLSFVRGIYDRGTVLDAADERLNGVFDERQMERVLVTGLWCACHDASRRPSVVQAVEALRAVGAELPVLAPARFGAERSLLELRAYGDLSVEFYTAHATAYLTSSDSSYLLAAEE